MPPAVERRAAPVNCDGGTARNEPDGYRNLHQDGLADVHGLASRIRRQILREGHRPAKRWKIQQVSLTPVCLVCWGLVRAYVLVRIMHLNGCFSAIYAGIRLFCRSAGVALKGRCSTAELRPRKWAMIYTATAVVRHLLKAALTAFLYIQPCQASAKRGLMAARTRPHHRPPRPKKSHAPTTAWQPTDTASPTAANKQQARRRIVPHKPKSATPAPACHGNWPACRLTEHPSTT